MLSLLSNEINILRIIKPLSIRLRWPNALARYSMKILCCGQSTADTRNERKMVTSR